jgi:diguanylate cyclase (GGDEF)-like protein
MNNILTQTSTLRHKLLAGLVVLIILGGLVSIAPVADRPAIPIGAFLPMFATAVFLTEGLTAYLLAVQFVLTRAPAVGILSAAYTFTAMLVAIQLLVFPGVFSSTGLLNAGSQSAVWLWVFWHGGFPAFILGMMLAQQIWPDASTARHNTLRGLFISIATPILIAAIFGFLAIRETELLPTLISGGDYGQLRHNPVALCVWILNLIALLAVCIRTRLRSVLHLWLAVAVLASLVDVSLTLLASNRYSIGWYVARLLSIISSTVVLGALLWEINRLYRELMRANDSLIEHTIRDPLTGLFNRRHLDKQLEIEMQRAHRQKEPLSVLMIDVDHFKVYIDAFGHQHGDKCLITVAEVLASSIHRPADFAARYGGEEFTIVLPNTDRQGAVKIAEEIRSSVSKLRLTAPEGHVTISVGGASCAQDTNVDPKALIARADEALYQAKHNGRDCVYMQPAPQNGNQREVR